MAARTTPRERPAQNKSAATLTTCCPSAGLTDPFPVGTRIRYRDNGDWISGVVESLDPVILHFDDQTQIRTTLDVLQAGVAEHLIEPQ